MVVDKCHKGCVGEPAKIWSTDIRIGRGLILNQGASRRKRKLLHSILYTWIVHYGVISKFPRTGYSTSFFFILLPPEMLAEDAIANPEKKRENNNNG